VKNSTNRVKYEASQTSGQLEKTIVVVLDNVKASIEYDKEFSGDTIKLAGLLQKDIQYLTVQVMGGHAEFDINEELSFVERLNCGATEY